VLRRSSGESSMTGTSRIGILLLLLLAGWVVLYYLLFSPIAHDEGIPEDGLNILETDSVGSNPDDQSPAVDLTPPSQPEQRRPQPANDERRVNNEGNNNATPGNVGEASKSKGSAIPPPPPTTPYTVKRGDTMETIASSWFGSKSKWVLIAHENPLVDPLKLKSGQTLRLPPKDAKLEGIPTEELRRLSRYTKYVVVDGDSLWKIAAKQYGNGALHKLIADANHDVLGNSNDLQIGMELVIPPYQKPAD
jgi:nucleoid-associated protein YgaU